jgi:ubiquinol-cytochrome c reductase iron-sulfur subunit
MVKRVTRKFLHMAMMGLTALGVGLSTIPFIRSWFPSGVTKIAQAPIRVDISRLQPGEMMTVAWQNKPVWVLRRTPEMMAQLQVDNPDLKDPRSHDSQQPQGLTNAYRSIDPEYFVVLGRCTHMGCIPLLNKKEFICPCHGSHFDLSGRVVKNVPAAQNLVVPPYHFVDGHKVLIIGQS